MQVAVCPKSQPGSLPKLPTGTKAASWRILGLSISKAQPSPYVQFIGTNDEYVPLQFKQGRLTMFITRLITDSASSRRRRRTTITHASLSDRQLSDLGVTRHDLFAPTFHR